MASHIPNYWLYGDKDGSPWLSNIDFEWIPQRSRPYQWNIQPHKHDTFTQVVVLTRGDVVVRMDQQSLKLEAPCVVLVPAQTVHGFRFSPDVDGPVITAAQNLLESLADLVMPALRQTLHTPLATPLTPAQLERLMPLFLAIETEYRQADEGHVAACMSLLIALMVQIHRALQREATPQMHAMTRRAAQIAAFRRLVDTHFRSHLPITEYASMMGLTAGQLTRLCQDTAGMPSSGVVSARILREAQRELIYTSSSIKQIAANLGFMDEAYFGRFFRKQTGMAPRKFRELSRTETQQWRKVDPTFTALAPPHSTGA